MLFRLKLGLLSWWWSFKLWWTPPELPPIVFTDTNGIGWTRTPDYQEAWQPDTGQNDVFKRLLWESMMQGAPVSVDLAAACQRLGFCYLAQSIGMSDEFARSWYLAKMETIETDAIEQIARVAAGPPQGPPGTTRVLPKLAELLQLYGLGPYEGAPLPEGRVRQPLKVLPEAELRRRVGSWSEMSHLRS